MLPTVRYCDYSGCESFGETADAAERVPRSLISDVAQEITIENFMPSPCCKLTCCAMTVGSASDTLNATISEGTVLPPEMMLRRV